LRELYWWAVTLRLIMSSFGLDGAARLRCVRGGRRGGAELIGQRGEFR
jgi:hypothetical protein